MSVTSLNVEVCDLLDRLASEYRGIVARAVGNEGDSGTDLGGLTTLVEGAVRACKGWRRPSEDNLLPQSLDSARAAAAALWNVTVTKPLPPELTKCRALVRCAAAWVFVHCSGEPVASGASPLAVESAWMCSRAVRDAISSEEPFSLDCAEQLLKMGRDFVLAFPPLPPEHTRPPLTLAQERRLGAAVEVRAVHASLLSRRRRFDAALEALQSPIASAWRGSPAQEARLCLEVVEEAVNPKMSATLPKEQWRASLAIADIGLASCAGNDETLRPYRGALHEARASLLHLLGDLDAALIALQHAAAHTPTATVALRELELHIEAGRPDDAETALQRIVASRVVPIAAAAEACELVASCGLVDTSIMCYELLLRRASEEHAGGIEMAILTHCFGFTRPPVAGSRAESLSCLLKPHLQRYRSAVDDERTTESRRIAKAMQLLSSEASVAAGWLMKRRATADPYLRRLLIMVWTAAQRLVQRAIRGDDGAYGSTSNCDDMLRLTLLLAESVGDPAEQASIHRALCRLRLATTGSDNEVLCHARTAMELDPLSPHSCALLAQIACLKKDVVELQTSISHLCRCPLSAETADAFMLVAISALSAGLRDAAAHCLGTLLQTQPTPSVCEAWSKTHHTPTSALQMCRAAFAVVKVNAEGTASQAVAWAKQIRSMAAHILTNPLSSSAAAAETSAVIDVVLGELVAWAALLLDVACPDDGTLQLELGAFQCCEELCGDCLMIAEKLRQLASDLTTAQTGHVGVAAALQLKALLGQLAVAETVLTNDIAVNPDTTGCPPRPEPVLLDEAEVHRLIAKVEHLLTSPAICGDDLDTHTIELQLISVQFKAVLFAACTSSKRDVDEAIAIMQALLRRIIDTRHPDNGLVQELCDDVAAVIALHLAQQADVMLRAPLTASISSLAVDLIVHAFACDSLVLTDPAIASTPQHVQWWLSAALGRGRWAAENVATTQNDLWRVFESTVRAVAAIGSVQQHHPSELYDKDTIEQIASDAHWLCATAWNTGAAHNNLSTPVCHDGRPWLAAAVRLADLSCGLLETIAPDATNISPTVTSLGDCRLLMLGLLPPSVDCAVTAPDRLPD